MKKEKLLETLERFGLNEKEADAYLTLLAMGETTATKLSERTGITRTLVYEIVAKLTEKGLVSSVIKEGVRYFSAARPEILIKELEERRDELKEIMPTLKELEASAEKEAVIGIYRGRKGVNTVLRTILEDGEDYYLLGGGKEGCEYFEHENKIFVKRAAKKGIHGYLLMRKGDDFFMGKLESVRYLSPKLIALTTTAVWGDKVAIFVWTEPYYVILIEDEKIAKSNLSTFQYLWKSAEKPTKADIKRRLFE